MSMKSKIFFSVFFSFFITNSVFSQTYLMNSTTHNTNNVTCAGTVYDNGGASGNFTANQSHIITFTPSTAGTAIQLTFSQWTVGSNSQLIVYDGPDTTYNSFGAFTTTVSPIGMQVMASPSNSSGSLTLLWVAGSTAAAGFAADISCHIPCQSIFVDIVPASCNPPMVGEFIDACPGEPITFVAQGVYNQNGMVYQQSDATTVFTWNFGDGTTATGSTVTHTYSESTGYDFSVSAVDVHGCMSTNYESGKVRISRNPMALINPPADICSGTSVNFTVGYATNSTIVLESISGGSNAEQELSDTTFLPDGSGASYTSDLNYTVFASGATLTDISDLLGICTNMEHSYMGDLKIELICPNGSSVILLDYPNSGGGNILGRPVATGLPVDNNTNDTTPGEGFDYCFSPTSTSGYIDDNANRTQLQTYTDPIGNVSTSGLFTGTIYQVNPGTYQAEGNWNNLIGCPLNGTWSIRVTDNLSSDNGYIFSWSLTFDSTLVQGGWEYSVPLDSVSWNGQYVISNSDTSAIATPTAGGTYTYDAILWDSFGCSYDTTFSINVVSLPQFDLGNDIAVCDNQVVQIDPNYNGSGATYLWSDNSTEEILSVSSPGVYCLTISQSNGTITCQNNDCINVNIAPQPTVDFSATPLEGCSPLLVSFTDLTTPNTVNYTYTWNFGDTHTSQNTSNQKNPAHIFSTHGEYDIYLKVVSPDGCWGEITKPAFIKVHPTPIANFNPSQTEVSLGDNPIVDFINTSSNFVSSETTWSWNFGDGSSSTEFSPSHEYADPNDYSIVLIVTTNKGCGDTVSKIIVVEDDIFIPNVITPNSDGINDVFVIGNINPQRINTLNIYNRWGKKVFDYTNYSTTARCKKLSDGSTSCDNYINLDSGWDGNNLADGVYYYVFVYQGIKGDVFKNGTITIIR